MPSFARSRPGGRLPYSAHLAPFRSLLGSELEASSQRVGLQPVTLPLFAATSEAHDLSVNALVEMITQ